MLSVPLSGPVQIATIREKKTKHTSNGPGRPKANAANEIQ